MATADLIDILREQDVSARQNGLAEVSLDSLSNSSTPMRRITKVPGWC